MTVNEEIKKGLTNEDTTTREAMEEEEKSSLTSISPAIASRSTVATTTGLIEEETKIISAVSD